MNNIVSGTSIGARTVVAILVSFIKENKTWEGSDKRLIEFWKYLSHSHLLKKYLILLNIGILGID